MDEETMDVLRQIAEAVDNSQHAIATMGAALAVIVSYLRIQDAVFAEHMPEQLQRALRGAQGPVAKTFAEEIVKAASKSD